MGRNRFGIRRLLIVLLTFSWLLVWSHQAIATDVGGPIVSDTTWTLAGSPYVFTGPVTVQNGATLRIEAGVEVQFNQSDLLVGASASSTGRLLAYGVTFRDSARVYLRYGSGQSVQNCDFVEAARLDLNNAASGTIADNDIVYTGSYNPPMDINGFWTVSGGTISLTATYGTDLPAIYCHGGGATISNVVITGTGSRAVYGVKATHNAAITGCTISGFRYPYFFAGGNQTILGNAIEGNDYLMIATGGGISQSSTFHSEWGLPVQIAESALQISSGATLTVDSGVDFRLNGRTFTVGALGSSQGRLVATEVTFTGPGSIRFTYGSEQFVQYCDFVGSAQAVLLSGASGSFFGNDFESSGSGPLEVAGTWTVSGGTVSLTTSSPHGSAVYCSGGEPTLSNVVITGSGLGAFYGVKATHSVSVNGCTISGFVYPYHFCGGSQTLSGNDISGNDSLMVATAGTLFNPGIFHSEWGLPIRVVGILTVMGGKMLTVDSGVEVRLNGGRIVAGESAASTGTLKADGVMFRGAGRVTLQYGPGQSVRNCGFVGAVRLVLGSGASGTIADNDITYSGTETPLTIDGRWTVAGGALSLAASSGILDGIACSGDTVTLSGLAITGSGDGAAYGVRASDHASISGCTISGFDYPYYFCGGDQTLSGNTIDGNDSLIVATGGEFGSSGAFHAEWGMPVKILTSGVSVRDGATLTVDPGVEVRLNGWDLVGGASPSSTGILQASGATFRGPGRVMLEYGSGQSVQDCDFVNGVRLILSSGASGTIADNDITYSGTDTPLAVDGTWAVTGGAVSLTAVSGTVAGTSLLGDSVALTDLVITGSGAGAAYGVKATTHASIAGCTISGFDYPYYFCGGDQTLSGNVISGNDSLIVATGGEFSSSGAFHSDWGMPVKILSDGVTVQDGASLTVEPGVELRLNGWDLVGGYSASSTGNVQATGATFHGPGLVRLQYGSGQSLQGCHFVNEARLNLNSGASGTIEDNDIAYSGTSVPLSGSGLWTISGGTVEGPAPSAVSWSSGTLSLVGVSVLNAPVGVKLSGSTTATAYLCSFIGTPTYGVENQATGQADARWCYWGDPSGPSGAGPGTGVPVSANVLFDPWLEEPGTALPDFLILSAVFDDDAYQNGVDVAHVTVVTKSNSGTSTGLSLRPSLSSNFGDRFDLPADGFSLAPWEEHISEFFWALPDSGHPWEFNLRLMLLDDGDTVLVYDNPSAFTGMLLTQEEHARALDTLYAGNCLPPEEACAIAAAGALPYVGMPDDVSDYVNDMCVAGDEMRAGRYLRAGIDLLGAVVSAMDVTLDVLETLTGVPVSTIPDQIDRATSCGLDLVLNWLPEDNSRVGALAVDTLLTEVADGFAEIGREYSNEIFVVGNAKLRVGVGGHWTGMDSLEITRAIVFGTEGDGLKWAHVGPGPVPFGAPGDNPHSAISVRIRAAESDTLEVGLLHRTEADSVLRLRYAPVGVVEGAVAWLDLADTTQAFPLQVDFNEDGIADITYFPDGGVEAGVDEGPVAAGGGLQLLANRPNPFNPATEIRYMLPVGAHVRLSIYDVAGRLMRILIDDRVAPGEHLAVWDGRVPTGGEVASGVYFAKLEAAGNVLTRKITLVR
jgi:hypothetical protein